MLFLEPLEYYRFLKKTYPNSFLAEDDFQVIIGIDCLAFSSKNMSFDELKTYHCTKDTSLAPFAGLFGVFSYNMVSYFEQIPSNKNKAYDFDDFYFYDALAYLHYDKISKIYTQYGDEKYFKNLQDLRSSKQATQKSTFKITTDLQKEQAHFNQMFKKAKEHLKNGDVFQVVLSEQLELQSDMDSLFFYQKLSEQNPSPYMYFLPTPMGDIVGSSPEIIVSMKNNEMIIEPIAGTRKRGLNPTEDRRQKLDLSTNEKELSEHKMLVDLARNDLSRVAKSTSVRVKELLNIAYYEHVMHITSKVVGLKKDDCDLFDVLKATFPAGTLSGTPKIKAMQIISALEDKNRNIYGGGLGFLHFNGDLQFTILIRSAIFVPEEKLSRVFIQAGAGIVYDSTMQDEYQEIINKRASCVNIFSKFSKEIK